MPETLFQAASISKPVTALAVMHLVQAGKLNLDTDVNKYLKTWKVPDNEFTAKTKVTLRELLSHTAGMTVHGFGGLILMMSSSASNANGDPVRSTNSIMIIGNGNTK